MMAWSKSVFETIQSNQLLRISLSVCALPSLCELWATVAATYYNRFIVEHLTGEYIGLDAESICQGMESMLDADTRRFLGENGRKNVLEWYDFRVMWPLVKELYERILK